MKQSIHQSKIYSLIFSFSMVLLLLAACKKDKTEPVKEPLKVTDYYPNSGNQGTLVTIEGTGFSSNASEISATFAGTAADVVSATPSAVVLRAPLKGSSGDIVMKMGAEALTIGKYTYQELSVRQISPANGAAGAHIRISGAGFSSLKGPAEVMINGKTSLVVSASDTVLVVEVPEAAGTGPVKVKVDGKEASGQTFKYQAIAEIKPLTGGKGTLVKITGEGFEDVAEGNHVDFNGKQALVKEATAGYLVVIAPAEVQTGPLSVTVNKQKVTGPVFTVVPVPLIETVSPLSGPAGSVMTIVGTTFSSIPEENKVTINGKVVPIATASGTQLTLKLPGGTGNGKVVLSVNDQVVQGPDFKDQSLGITTLSPENGLAGTQVTITGTGFSNTAAQNIVTFNGVAATVVSATETSLVVKAPTGLTTGPLKVNTNGTEALAPVVFSRAGVVTLAGGIGNSDLNIAAFRTGSLAIDRQGNIYVLEVAHSRVKKITPQGKVTLFAGSPTGERGNKNAQGAEALFNFGVNPGMEIDPDDNLYIGDAGNQSIRKVSPQGVVSNFSINLSNPQKITFDDQGMLYVMGSFSGGWKIDKSGLKTIISPSAMLDESRPAIFNDKLYKVGNESYYIQLYDLITNQNSGFVGGDFGYADGIGRQAMFGSIKSLVSDGKGNVFVADGGNTAIRKVNIASKTVTTVAKFTRGANVDGAFNEVKAGDMGDMIMDKDGNLYFIDTNNNAVRKIFLK